MSEIKLKELGDNGDVCNIDLENEYKSSCGENNLTKNCNKFTRINAIWKRVRIFSTNK